MKTHASENSSAIRNATEITNALIDKYGRRYNAPPTLTTYTDGGKEHCSNFLSVQIAMIALQHFCDLQILIAVRTAPGHSYTNPPEKINCILDHGHNVNLGLDLKSKFLIVLGFMM